MRTYESHATAIVSLHKTSGGIFFTLLPPSKWFSNIVNWSGVSNLRLKTSLFKFFSLIICQNSEYFPPIPISTRGASGRFSAFLFLTLARKASGLEG